MAFHHRKLLNETAVDPAIARTCEKYCDAEENPDWGCPFTCMDLCPPVCKFPLLENPPPDVVPSSPPEKSHRLSLLLSISFTVLSAAFFIFICYAIYKFYSNLYSPDQRRRRRRRSQQEEVDDGGPADHHFLDEVQGPALVDHPIWYIRTIGLQPAVIGAITIVNYKKGDGLIDGTDCSVCLNEFQEDETLRLLPKCNHAFHVTCIDTWLRSHTNCPMCRAGIVNNSAAGLPSQEQQIDQNSGLNPVVEEARQGISGSNREVENNESPPELRIGIEEDSVSRAQNGLKINEDLNNSDPGVGGLDGIQALRRSISADSLSAIVNAFPGQSDRNSVNHDQLVEVKESTSKRGGFNQSLLRLIGNPSIQTGSSSMKRSVSCSTRNPNRNWN